MTAPVYEFTHLLGDGDPDEAGGAMAAGTDFARWLCPIRCGGVRRERQDLDPVQFVFLYGEVPGWSEDALG